MLGFMTARSVDRAVEGYARRQHGAFHHRQALRIGATPGIIRRRLAAGTWVRLADSQVYALPSHPGSWLRQCMAATLSVPGSAISGAAAAAVHDMPEFPRAGIEVVTRLAGTHRSPFAAVRRSGLPIRTTVVDGIRVIRAPDCVAELASRLERSRLEVLVGELAHQRRGFLDDLRDTCVDLSASRLPGIANLRWVLGAHGEGEVPPRSELERLLRDLLRTTPEVPKPQWEATPSWYEPGEARVDVLIPEWSLIVEADGRRWHARVDDFEADRWRDNVAQAHGHAVLRFTWRRLTRERSACRHLLITYARTAGLLRPVSASLSPHVAEALRRVG